MSSGGRLRRFLNSKRDKFFLSSCMCFLMCPSEMPGQGNVLIVCILAEPFIHYACFQNVGSCYLSRVVLDRPGTFEDQILCQPRNFLSFP